MRFNVFYDVPSTAETMGMFFLDIALYSLLAFYFDHVDESNRGKSYEYLFFLKGSYWFGENKHSKKVSSLPSNDSNTNDEIASSNRQGSLSSLININSVKVDQKLLIEQINGLNKNGNFNST
jgi:hypothetical protein